MTCVFQPSRNIKLESESKCKGSAGWINSRLLRSALRASVEWASGSGEARRALLAPIIPEATYRRRHERRTRDESEKAERLASVVATTGMVKLPRVRRHDGSCDDDQKPVDGSLSLKLIMARCVRQWTYVGTT